MKLLTATEASRIIGRCAKTVQRWMRLGYLPVKKVRGRNYISEEALYKWLEEGDNEKKL